MSGSTTRPELRVDLAAVTANTAALARHTGVAVMAVVKAGGFGHGDVAVARAALAGGATWLGVASLTEALALRMAGLTAPVLSWLNPVGAELGVALAAGVDVAVASPAHLDVVARAAADLGTTARVHLHLDCGMARDGAPWRLWPSLCARAALAQRAGAVRVVGVMGHLSCADVPTDPANREGRTRFVRGLRVVRAAGLTPQHRHLAATAAALADPRARHTMVRIGAGLYGIDYGLGGHEGAPRLRQAATLTAPVVAVHDVAAGTPVGYGGTWVAPQATRLALLPIGYADGVPRAASWTRARAGRGPAQVLLGGERCPVVGRLSMDSVVVDVGGLPVRPGDVATVFGPGDRGEPTLRDWARWADTLEHEIVTGIGRRVARVAQVRAAEGPCATSASPSRATSASPSRAALPAAV